MVWWCGEVVEWWRSGVVEEWVVVFLRGAQCRCNGCSLVDGDGIFVYFLALWYVASRHRREPVAKGAGI